MCAIPALEPWRMCQEFHLLTGSEVQCTPHVDRTDCELIIADYDVYIWDLEPGEHFSNLYNTVQEVSAGFQSPGMSLVHHGRLDTRASSFPASR